jgi:hypothetical protein
VALRSRCVAHPATAAAIQVPSIVIPGSTISLAGTATAEKPRVGAETFATPTEDEFS